MLGLINYWIHPGFCLGMLKEENKKRLAKSRLGAKECRFTQESACFFFFAKWKHLSGWREKIR